ncbi:unnamed protein product [Penicillium egyptiacum]|uniref:Protein kinase domain-containing protein n=1 Tax=Penicillium egyptiacum TaxID=1303716 RepID=A0A9W4KHL6_9EURO|nr:unnamed protein product [Penicillium egyptiacum]
MQLEVLTYRLPRVASAECFRKIYDMIVDSTIDLEWLDTTLAELEYHPNMRTYSLIRSLLRAAFTSRVVLEDYKYVNTVVPVGELLNAQPYAIRAPEVFLGKACTEPSQVWAVAAMLLCWIKPGVLGAWDSPHPLINEVWAMTKIPRLFPYWEISTPETDTLVLAVNSARSLNRGARSISDFTFGRRDKKGGDAAAVKRPSSIHSGT